MSGFLSRQSRRIDPHPEMRRGKRAQNEVCLGTRYSSQVGMRMSGNFLNCIKVSSTDSNFKRVRGISFEMLQWERASSRFEGRIQWFSSRFLRKFGVPLVLRHGSGSARIASGKSGHILSCDKHFWIPLKSLQGKYTSDRLVSTNSVFLSSGDRDFWVAFKVHLGNQASS